MSTLTIERLRAALNYDPVTGVFTWKIRTSPRVAPGDVAGHLGKSGYVSLRLDGVLHQAHRLAWFYVHGEWPVDDLDHKDTMKSHNALGNLRPATDSQNLANVSLRADNCSGVKGVSWRARSKKWRAQIKVRGREYYLGLFDTIPAAAEAYKNAAAKHFGEYARTV
jgi:hypothetical protein